MHRDIAKVRERERETIDTEQPQRQEEKRISRIFTFTRESMLWKLDALCFMVGGSFTPPLRLGGGQAGCCCAWVKGKDPAGTG